jgi:hypothetical protein
MKKHLISMMVLFLLVTSGISIKSTTGVAEEPALLKTTIVGGFGLTVKIKNIGNMSASNISYNCFVLSNTTDRYRLIEKELVDLAPNEEIILHHLFFFIGKANIGAGPGIYFNGEEYKYLDTPIQDAFTFGPFVKLLGFNQ